MRKFRKCLIEAGDLNVQMERYHNVAKKFKLSIRQTKWYVCKLRNDYTQGVLEVYMRVACDVDSRSGPNPPRCLCLA